MFTLAYKYGYQPYLYWSKDFSNTIQEIPFKLPLPTINNNHPLFSCVQIVETEWFPSDYWYSKQSEAQSNIQGPFYMTKKNLDWKTRCLLIETSLQLVDDLDVSNIYQNFIPLKSIDHYPEADVAIYIERGLINYFPEANQSKEEITEWLIKNFRGETIYLFPDDIAFCLDIVIHIEKHLTLKFAEDWFDQFLIMATKVKLVFGTPHSSFAKQATLFGKREYRTILDV